MTSTWSILYLLLLAFFAACAFRSVISKPIFFDAASQAKFQWAIDEIINSDSKTKFEW